MPGVPVIHQDIVDDDGLEFISDRFSSEDLQNVSSTSDEYAEALAPLTEEDGTEMIAVTASELTEQAPAPKKSKLPWIAAGAVALYFFTQGRD